jgi:hypothetical protein
LLAVVRRETGVRWIETPPALESPEALVADPESWYPRPASTRIARFEVEEPLEDGRRARAVRLALARVEQDHARRPRTDLVAWSLGPPAVAALAARLLRPRGRTAWLNLTLRTTRRSRRRRRRSRLDFGPSRPESSAARTFLHARSLGER